MQGTPKTLKQAIMNGLQEAVKVRMPANVSAEEIKAEAQSAQDAQMRIVEEHVLDFFRQKFGVAYMDIERWFEDRSYKDPASIVRELAEATGVARKDRAA